MKKIIGSPILAEQTTFVSGRSISDGVVVVNEILDLVKRMKRECMVLKIDFGRAYDCVSWNFLRYLLRKLNFGDRWIVWIKALVFKGFMLILINSSVIRILWWVKD